MPSKTYKYSTVIGVSINSSGAKKGAGEVEKELSRVEKRVLKAVAALEKYEKAIESVQKASASMSRANEKIFNDNSARDGGSNRRWTREHNNIYKATQLVNRYDLSISKLSGKQTELQKLNQQLADPRVARNIDDRTKAILRERAAIIDSIKAGNQLEKQNARTLAQKTRTAQKRAENIQTVGGGMQSAGVTATAIATVPIVAGFYAAIKAGTEYEASMNMLQAVTSATAEEMRKADEIAIKLGADTRLSGVSAKDAAEAMTELGKAGFTVADAMAAAEGTLRLARAAGIGAAQAAEIQSNALNMFGLAASEANRVADLFAGAANASSAEITDLALSLSQAGAVFANAKVPIEDVVTLIGELANAGIKGSDAGTSLKTMLQRLQSPTDAAAATLKALNVEVYDSQGKMRSMRDIIGQFEKSLNGLSQQQKDQALNTIFGADAVRAASIIFKQGTEGFDKMTEAVQRANAAQLLAEARTKGLGGAWEALKSQAETLALVVYNRIKEPLTELAVFAGVVLSKVTDWFTNLSEPVQRIILVIGALVAALGPLVTIAGTVILALGGLAASITALGGLATIAPIIGAITIVIGVLTAGIALAVGAVWGLVEAWQNGFGPIASVVAVAVGAILSVISPLLGLPILIGAMLITIYEVWTTNFGGLRDFTVKFWETIKSLFNSGLSKVLELVNQVLGQIVGFWEDNYLLIERVVLKFHDAVKSAVVVFLMAITGFWNTYGDQILSVVGFIWNSIKSVISAGMDIIGSIVRTILLFMDGQWEQGWKNILLTLRKFIGYIVSAVKSMYDNVNKIVTSAAKWLYENYGAILASIGKLTVQGLKYLVGLIAGLPVILIKLVPKFISAGMQIGQAVWQGIKDGLSGNSNSPEIAEFNIASLFDSSPAEKAAKGVENLADAFDKLGKKTTENTEKAAKYNKELAATNETSKKARKAVGNSRVDNLLPSRGAGFNSYRSPNAKFATESTIDNLERLGQIWSQMSNKAIQIGDIAKKGGGALAGHKAHKDGNQADIRPFRLDGRNLPTNINDPSYDRDTTRKFIQTLKNVIPGAVVLFNDPQLIKEGLTKFAKGHGNHLHVNRLGGKFSAKNSGRGSVLSDLDQFNQSQSDAISKAEKERILNLSIETYRNLGIMPDEEMIRDFNGLMIEEARKAGKLQPSLDDTKKLFAGLRGPGAVQDAELSARPLNRRDQRFLETNKSLGLIDENGKSAREIALQERRLYLADEINIRAEDYRIGLQEQLTDMQVELGLLQRRNIAVETSVEFEKQRNDQIRALGDVERDLAVLRGQNADENFVNQRRILDAKRDQLAIENDIVILQDKIANVGENSALRYKRAWLDAVREVKEADIEAVESQIRSQVKLESAMVRSNDQIRAKVLDHLASQKTLNESIADGIVNLYEKAAGGIEKLLDKSIGKIPIIGDIAKAGARNLLTKITTGLLDKFLPSEFSEALKSTGNPVLDENKKQTDYLKKISDAVTGTSVSGIATSMGSGASSGGGLFGMIRKLLGIGGGGGQQQGFPYAMNAGALTSNGGIQNTLVTPDGKTFSTGGNNTIWGNIKNVFSTKEGGIFAPKQNILTGKDSKLAGIMGGIGGLASMAGGMIGGKWGNVIGMAGTGMQIGSMFGPIGAGIGAAAGALIGLFSGDPKRKADKQQNLPALQKGFTEALAALRALASNKKLLFNDPDGAIGQAKELRAQIESSFGIEFQSKKYKKIAQQQITQKLAEADALIKQIESEAALQRNKRAKMESYAPTFADGGHISKFIGKAFQNNPLGYLTGPGTGRSDSILARVSNGEYVLDAETVKNIGLRRLDLLRLTKGRGADRLFRSLSSQSIGFAEGGAVGISQSQPSQNNSVQRGNVTVNNYVTPFEGGARVETEVYEDDRLLERRIEEIIYENGPDGKIPKAINNMRRGKY